MHNPATDLTPPIIRETAKPAGILLADHFVEPYGYAVWRPHGTRDWLITWTVGGMGRYCCEGETVFCTAGTVAVLAPGTLHDYATAKTDEPWDFYWAHFVPRPHWSPWLALVGTNRGLSVAQIQDEAAQQRLVHAFQRVIDDNRRLGTYHEELALNGLEEALLVVIGQQTQPAKLRLDPRIERLIEQLAIRLDAPLDLHEAAATVALSPSRLAHLFKAEVGDSIGRWHMRLRLRHAARLLTFTTHSIGEIAHDVGFQSPFHFSRQFKLFYNESPHYYRKRVSHEL